MSDTRHARTLDPFPTQASGTTPVQSTSSHLSTSPTIAIEDTSRTSVVNNSLALNYLPQKFTRPVSASSEGLAGRSSPAEPRSADQGANTDNRTNLAVVSGEGLQQRKSIFSRFSKSPDPDNATGALRRGTKQGGGRDAFREHETRMPEADDEDYDGVDIDTSKGHVERWKIWKSGMHWNRFKLTLFATNLILFLYSLITLIYLILTWLKILPRADIVRVGNTTELILSTVAASLGLFTSMLGFSGILLNNRSFLALYTFLLWVVFGFLVAPGYITYKKRTFNLDGKINAQWSRDLGTTGRLRIQNELLCCGYYSPYVEATVSSLCYARSNLEGCKSPYLNFQRKALKRWYTASFALVPVQIMCMISGLLCSNYVTYRFGKGMTPRRYRLSMHSMAAIMDKYANQLAEQYGSEVVSGILRHSKISATSATGKDYEYSSVSQRDIVAPSRNSHVKKT